MLLALEPEELAGYLLEHLNDLPETQHDRLTIHNTLSPERLPHYREQIQVSRALAEAWGWLEREGLIAPVPGAIGAPGYHFITRRGRRLRTHVDVEAVRRGNLLPRAQLHPLIADAVWPEFLRGRYDTSVFNALREVEIAVRTAGNYTAAEFGDRLFRLAFHEETGPLRDRDALPAERLALSHLVAGTFGCFSNPTRHREVGTDAVQAVEIITLASLLMRIVDERAQANIAG